MKMKKKKEIGKFLFIIKIKKWQNCKITVRVIAIKTKQPCYIKTEFCCGIRDYNFVKYIKGSLMTILDILLKNFLLQNGIWEENYNL